MTILSLEKFVKVQIRRQATDERALTRALESRPSINSCLTSGSAPGQLEETPLGQIEFARSDPLTRHYRK